MYRVVNRFCFDPSSGHLRCCGLYSSRPAIRLSIVQVKPVSAHSWFFGGCEYPSFSLTSNFDAGPHYFALRRGSRNQRHTRAPATTPG